MEKEIQGVGNHDSFPHLGSKYLNSNWDKVVKFKILEGTKRLGKGLKFHGHDTLPLPPAFNCAATIVISIFS